MHWWLHEHKSYSLQMLCFYMNENCILRSKVEVREEYSSYFFSYYSLFLIHNRFFVILYHFWILRSWILYYFILKYNEKYNNPLKHNLNSFSFHYNNNDKYLFLCCIFFYKIILYWITLHWFLCILECNRTKIFMNVSTHVWQWHHCCWHKNVWFCKKEYCAWTNVTYFLDTTITIFDGRIIFWNK